MSAICARCSKIVYPVEKIDAGNQYHKGCFRCMDESCNISLNLKTFQTCQGKIFCPKHVPSFKASSVLDKNTAHAMNAPRRSSEGLHKTFVAANEAESNSSRNSSSSLEKKPTSSKIKGIMENFESKGKKTNDESMRPSYSADRDSEQKMASNPTSPQTSLTEYTREEPSMAQDPMSTDQEYYADNQNTSPTSYGYNSNSNRPAIPVAGSDNVDDSEW